ncbi:DUF5958 family protein [Streptomyces bobili]|uniref:DUF5958 family protein n=1 Tax=Streptomyces bobili TaxID=67280 RepID=UPI0036FB0BC6
MWLSIFCRLWLPSIGRPTPHDDSAAPGAGPPPSRVLTIRRITAHSGNTRSTSNALGCGHRSAPTRQQEVLREVAGYAMQAHITAADGRAGVARSGVKPTANPSVMICMDPPRYGFADLPSAEHVRAFRVLVSVFAVADTRRRETYCKGACGHACHNLPAGTEQP